MAAPFEKPARTLKRRVEEFERRLIRAALERTGGNQRKAATALGIRPSTLCEKLKRLRIGVARHVVDLVATDARPRSPL